MKGQQDSAPSLRDVLRRVRDEGLLRGWLYLRDHEPTLDTRCVFIAEEKDADRDERGLSRIAVARGFPHSGLDGGTLREVVDWVRQFEDPPGDELMLESFLWYFRNDAFLPEPGAPAPPPNRVVERKIDRDFYDSLGPERAGTRCAEPGCVRGAVAFSTLWRPHHFEMIRKMPCPFDE